MRKILLAAAAVTLLSAPAMAQSVGFETGGSIGHQSFGNTSAGLFGTATVQSNMGANFFSGSAIQGVAGWAPPLAAGTGSSNSNLNGSVFTGMTVGGLGNNSASVGSQTSFGTGFGFSWGP